MNFIDQRQPPIEPDSRLFTKRPSSSPFRFCVPSTWPSSSPQQCLRYFPGQVGNVGGGCFLFWYKQACIQLFLDLVGINNLLETNHWFLKCNARNTIKSRVSSYNLTYLSLQRDSAVNSLFVWRARQWTWSWECADVSGRIIFRDAGVGECEENIFQTAEQITQFGATHVLFASTGNNSFWNEIWQLQQGPLFDQPQLINLLRILR